MGILICRVARFGVLIFLLEVLLTKSSEGLAINGTYGIGVSTWS